MATIQKLIDGFSMLDGVDSGNDPLLVGRSKLAWGRNISLRGGLAHSRPSFTKRTLANPSSGLVSGLFQGAAPYFDYHSSQYSLIVAIAGRIFQVNLDDYTSREITIAGDANYPTSEKVWIEQADIFLIIQDGLSKPFIFDGSLSFRPSSTQVPVGKQMKYVNGRLWIATPDGSAFVGGDLIYSSSGTLAYGRRDAVLYFTQNEFLVGGGKFGIPMTSGKINALSEFGQIDSSLGQGPLQVFTERGAFSVNAPADRTTWQSLSWPIQTVSMIGAGALAQEATVTVNGDVWFRSPEGIRSFQIARRDIGSWANTPMSFEMQRVFGADDRNHLDHCSAAWFDSRLLTLASPFRAVDSNGVYRGVQWRSIVALDFSPVSQIGRQRQPNFDGVWTGLNVMQIVVCGPRCFLFALNQSSAKFELWEISSELADRTFGYDKDGTIPISSRIETGALDFNSTPARFAALNDVLVWGARLFGSTAFSTSFRPESYPGWVPWKSWSENVKNQMCPLSCPTLPGPLSEQIRPAMRSGLVPEVCDPQPQRPSKLQHIDTSFQLAMDISGPFEIKRVLVMAEPAEIPIDPRCDSAAQDTSGISVCEAPFAYDSTAGV